MKKKLIVIIPLTIGLLTYYLFRPNPIETKIWEQVQAGGPVILKDITKFDWDSVAIIGPYATRQTAERVIGCPWPGYESSDIACTDSKNVLIFLNNEAIVEVVCLPRNRGGFLFV